MSWATSLALTGCIARPACLVSDVLPVSPGIRTEWVRKYGCTVDADIHDVIGVRTLGRIELGEVAHALGDFVVGAGRIATGSETTYASRSAIERDATAKGNRPAADSSIRGCRFCRRTQTIGTERIAIRDAPQRMARQAERVEARRGQRHGVRAECVRGVS